MAGTPNTIGLLLLFVVTFLACILWATSGSIGGHHDAHEEDTNSIEKPS